MDMDIDRDGAAANRVDGSAAAATVAPAEPVEPELGNPRALQLYRALDRTPRDLGEVAAMAGLSASEAMSLAIDLELGGWALRAAGGRYLRAG